MVGEASGVRSERYYGRLKTLHQASVHQEFLNTPSGFMKVKALLAVNQNPKEMLFDMADSGLVCNVHKILPHLVTA